MYIDAIVVVALIIVAFCWFRRISKTVYAVAIIDIFLRLLNYISANIGIKGFHKWVSAVFPASLPDLLDNYMSGVVLTVFVWIYVGLMVIFLFYIVRAFLRKK
ncbi:MAG: hypothetical protein IKL65_03555 [Bacilli bacterium]|nr:hypothetical protein [Bacilli bacterium]